jgi:hypothetical protein
MIRSIARLALLTSLQYLYRDWLTVNENICAAMAASVFA